MIALKKAQNKGISEKKRDNTREMTKKFLKHAKKIDFGRNWIKEIDLLS